MSDFDFNLNFLSGKNKNNDRPQENKDINEAGLSLESKYITNKEARNQIVPVPKSLLSLYSLHKSSTNSKKQNLDQGQKSVTIKPSFLGKINFSFFNKIPKFKTNKKWRLYPIIALFAILSVLLVTSLSSNKISNSAQAKVAGVVEKAKAKTGKKETTEAYKSWISDKLGAYHEPDEDFDGDQLTNDEEFIIGSEPNNPNSCDPKKTDSENLVEFINPVTCKAIDVSDNAAMEKFKKVVDFNSVRSKVIQSEVKNTKDEAAQASPTGSVMSLFGVSSLENLNKQEFNSSKFKSELDLIKTKQESIDKINKINKYMKESRSLEPYDRNYPIPVNGAVYMEVSLKYNVPLKYTLAVAQRESRFGTDAYDKDGNLTRPGKYKNIFSMGLDDEGNNVGFETWEKGVESFGRWYKRFNDRGFSDCSKWRIYNPNGDYCKAIEETASQIESYLNK
jgi:hypothetical protein